MEERMLEGRGGTKIFVRAWRPRGDVRAAVVLVHGLKAHGGMFEWAARQLVEHDLAVYALDLRGHGRSEGERLYVDSFDDYTSDVDTLVAHVRESLPGTPIFVLGHSAGGVISSAYALDHQGELAGLVCESFAQEVPAPAAVLRAIRGLSRIAPHLGVLDLDADDFSRDPAFVARMKQDPLIPARRYPTRTVAELARAEDHLARSFPRFSMPVLILHGTDDRVTLPHGSQVFFENAGSDDKTLRLYEGHAHDLLNDLGREQVLGEITGWIDAHLPS